MTSVAATWRRASIAAVRDLGRSALIGSVAGMVAGLLAGGIGSRIAMTLVAIADPSAHGLLTSNSQIVGAMSMGGSLFLVLFATFVSAFHGGLLYIAYGRLMPGSTAIRGLLFGAALLAVFGAEIIEPTNHDFVRFAAPAWDIGLFAVLFVAFGLTAAGVGADVDRRLPSVDAELGWVFALAGVGLIVFWLVIGTLIAADGDPYLIAVFGGAIGVAALAHLFPGRLTTWVGRAVLLGVSTVGAVGLVGGIVDIVSRDARLP